MDNFINKRNLFVFFNVQINKYFLFVKEKFYIVFNIHPQDPLLSNYAQKIK